MYNIVPSLGLTWKFSDRIGRYIELPKISGKVVRIKTLKEATILAPDSQSPGSQELFPETP